MSRHGIGVRRAFALIALLATASCIDAARARSDVRVVEIIDGDTLAIETAGGRETVRVIGVDAPELSHPESPEQYLARESADALAGLLDDGRAVLIDDARAGARDRFGRRLAHVRTSAGADVAIELLEAGLARVLDRYENDRHKDHEAAEARARAAGLGIWKDGGRAEVRWLRAQRRAPLAVHPMTGGRYAVEALGRVRAGVTGAGLSDALWAARRALGASAQGDESRARRILDDEGFVPLN